MNVFTLVMIVPVVLVVALIMVIVRRNITERGGKSLDISSAIPAVIVALIAVMVIGSVVTTSMPDSEFDEDTGELTILKDPKSSGNSWDRMSGVTSLVITKDVSEVPAGAFSTLTGLHSVTIEGEAEIASGAFAASFYSPTGAAIATPGEGEYLSAGTAGELYYADPSLFTYNGGTVTGLTSAGAAASYIAVPSEHDGTAITAVAGGSLNSATSIVKAALGSNVASIGDYVLSARLTLTGFESHGPLASYGSRVFNGCTGLVDFELSPSTVTIGSYAFNGVSAASFAFPSTVQSIDAAAFVNCREVTQVSFAPGFAASLSENAFTTWTFYASDGVTEISKTSASALAGKTFMGTASALVEVSAGTLSLTPQQIQQVNLHTMEDQDLDIQPMPFQPAVQTQDQEPVSA